MAKVFKTMYLNSDKEYNYEVGEELGMDEDALNAFKYNLYEVKFLMEIDTDTGESRILKVDNMRVQDPSPVEDESEKDDYLARLGVR